jgi:hypothetical protein
MCFQSASSGFLGNFDTRQPISGWNFWEGINYIIQSEKHNSPVMHQLWNFFKTKNTHKD